MKKKKIQIINGPNLNLLGQREPEVYGRIGFESYLEELKKRFPTVELGYFQSNSEGLLVDALQRAGFESDGVVLNAAAYTHTSIALLDTIRAVPAPVVEVHLSNIYAREPFRQHSMLSAACRGVIAGLGLSGYAYAIETLIAEANTPHPPHP